MTTVRNVGLVMDGSIACKVGHTLSQAISSTISALPVLKSSEQRSEHIHLCIPPLKRNMEVSLAQPTFPFRRFFFPVFLKHQQQASRADEAIL